MPCYTQQTSVVTLGPQTDVPLLKKALEALGYGTKLEDGLLTFFKFGEFGEFDGTALTLTGNRQQDPNVFKRAYSEQVVKSAAQRFGWKVQQTEDNKFQVQRRY